MCRKATQSVESGGTHFLILFEGAQPTTNNQQQQQQQQQQVIRNDVTMISDQDARTSLRQDILDQGAELFIDDYRQIG